MPGDSDNSFVSFASQQFSISIFKGSLNKKINDVIKIKQVKDELNKRKISTCPAPSVSLRITFHRALCILRIN